MIITLIEWQMDLDMSKLFSNIQTIHKNLNLEPVVGTLKSVEETLNNGMIEIEKMILCKDD